MLIDVIVPDEAEFDGGSQIRNKKSAGSIFKAGETLFFISRFQNLHPIAVNFSGKIVEIIDENKNTYFSKGSTFAVLDIPDFTSTELINSRYFKISKTDIDSKSENLIKNLNSKIHEIELRNQELAIILRNEGDISKKINENKEKIQLMDEDLSKMFIRIDEQEKLYDLDLKEIRSSHMDLSDKIDGKDAELKQLNESFLSKLATDAPRDFWEIKKEKHNRAGIVYGVAAFAFAGICLWLALSFGRELLGEISLKPDDLVLWPLGLFATCGFVVVWIERILVRLMLSHLHLADDANERIVMVETYFAILATNAEKTGEAGMDLGIMLQTLFRPAATGIIKDEGVPAQFWDLANRAIGSGGAKPGGPG